MNFSLEIGPHTDLNTLPPVKDVYVTMLPGGDYKETASKSGELVKKGFNPVPHFPARSINDETEFSLNEFGIKEPNDGNHFIIENLDIIFIPLLAFDIEGHRVGYGKGYYDRFLKLTNNSTLKIGLSFFDPINKILDIDDNDVKLDYCVTPKKVHKFNNL